MVIYDLDGKIMTRSVYHGGSELEARGVLDHHIVYQILEERNNTQVILYMHTDTYLLATNII